MNRSCVHCVHFDPAPGSLWGCPPAATDWSIAVGIPDGETAWPEEASACPGYDKREPASSPDPSTQTQLPPDWRPLREAAEAEAREVYAIEDGEWNRIRMESGRTRDIRMAFDTLPRFERESRVAAHAALLADLRRPASRDVWARWLAEKVGLTCEATAPRWYRDGDGGRRAIRWEIDASVGGWVTFADPATGHVEGNWIKVPGISALTDPAAALRAALLAVNTEAPHGT